MKAGVIVLTSLTVVVMGLLATKLFGPPEEAAHDAQTQSASSASPAGEDVTPELPNDTHTPATGANPSPTEPAAVVPVLAASAEEPPAAAEQASTAASRTRRAVGRRRASRHEASTNEPTHESTTPPVEQAPATPAATGRLSLVTTPWSEVYLGGRRLGTTPLIGATVPEGTHVLTLRNPEEHIETQYTVRVRTGEHTRARISLR